MTTARKHLLMHILMVMLTSSTMFRTLLTPCPTWLPRGHLSAIFVVFFILLGMNIWLQDRSPAWINLSLFLQTIITFWIVWIFRQESPTMMLLALGIQALMLLSTRSGYIWLVLLVVMMTSLQVAVYGWMSGLSVSLIYQSAFLFMAFFTYLLKEQDRENRRSQTLLYELREAHQTLKTYTSQAEQLAVAEERTRLARELHDSVTQMLFSISLLSKASVVLADKQAPKLTPQLEQIQTLAQDALSEMRYLIFQLRADKEEKGLLLALRDHISNIQKHHSIRVKLKVDKEPPLKEHQSHALFRIIQEALNNVIKHAETDQAIVGITTSESHLTIWIKDEGVGFVLDSAEEGERETMGLSTMRERTILLDAEFVLQSEPGKGTLVQIELPLTAEVE